MKNKYYQLRNASLLAISLFLTGANSTFGQDSIRIKNRHDVPDTARDTTKLNGGALIDTIHTKQRPDSGMMQKPDTTSSTYNEAGKTFAMAQDDRKDKIKSLETDIASMKKSLSGKDVAFKSAVATLENKKNELKATLKNNPTMDEKQKQKWDNDYSELKTKIDNLKNK